MSGNKLEKRFRHLKLLADYLYWFCGYVTTNPFPARVINICLHTISCDILNIYSFIYIYIEIDF